MLETLIAGVSGIIAAAIGAWAVLRARQPYASRVELLDVSFAPPDPSRGGTMVANLDGKVRNAGALSAVLTRLVVTVDQVAWFPSIDFMPYDEVRIAGILPVSAEYGVVLPAPQTATGARVTSDLSQVIAPLQADRFVITLSYDAPTLGTAVYLIRLQLWHDTNDRPIESRPIATALPQLGLSDSPEQIRWEVLRFTEAVLDVRQAIDHEMASTGHAVPEWDTTPPLSRQELPSVLQAVDGDGGDWRDSLGRRIAPGVFWANDRFWNPQASIDRYLQDAEDRYRRLIDILNQAHITDTFLRERRRQAEAALRQLPSLRTELATTFRS
ncbi:hypothetical protein AB0L42_37945 [Streptomyces sp. NPDC052287]|uniref:hypothetical protein n=1 Tax=Streptomyces sp. NPDC052287 TaxID=3154950 RepID=UPI00344504B7